MDELSNDCGPAERQLRPDNAWGIDCALAFNVLRRKLSRAPVTATLGGTQPVTNALVTFPVRGHR